ncbi:MAG: Glu/Leu/Phe/Val dehydrogenase dimerization domain-containing protein [Pseudodesulfovibrio sp.]|uniref:Glu/Leu/Phe/Val dehydrogenase dimerization domain-containing protein n=1 Tax=Pseudodesulfovibrio sp. TaxID=2035812 RepID=UPI003D09CBC2
MKRTFVHLTISTDLGDGCSAEIVIDSICNNTSSGGVRVASAINTAEVTRLAQEMSLKYAFSGLPRGGAKTGIMLQGSLSKEEKLQKLRLFGQSAAPILQTGIYYPGMDMNCGPEELTAIYAGAGIPIGPPTDTSLFTALSAEAALQAYRRQRGLDSVTTIAIEGFGSVATHLIKRLDEKEFRVVGISTIDGAAANRDGYSKDALLSAKQAHGDGLVGQLPGGGLGRESIFDVEADIFIPSARVGSLSLELAAGLKAASVIPIANAPYQEGVVEALEGRGVTCLPGFIVNNGGVFASSLFDSGVGVEAIEHICSDLYSDVLHALLDKAAALKVSPVDMATSIARKEFDAASSNDSIVDKVMRKAIVRRAIPRQLAGRLHQKAFIRHLDKLRGIIAQYA